MKIEVLKRILENDGITPNAFDLDGGHLPERYTLSQDSEGWHVYYSERGLETGKRSFKNESEACDYILHLIRSDADLVRK